MNDLQRKYPEFSFAYQPIVDVKKGEIVSFEALVRGINNEPAYAVLNGLSPDQIARFEKEGRLKAIALAVKLGLPCHINLNMMPNTIAGDDGSPLDDTVAAGVLQGLRPEQLILEMTENDIIQNFARFEQRVAQCRAIGVKFAIDDFGAGYSGLNLLAEFQPDILKLDMALIRNIHSRGPRQAIVRGILRTSEDLGIDVLAEGVETMGEYEWLYGEGIVLFQGYLFSRPSFEALSTAYFPS
jgi:blue light- and temperature-responsive anti-repressor